MGRNALKLSVIDPLDLKQNIKFNPGPMKLNQKAVWTPNCMSLLPVFTSIPLSFFPIQKEAKATTAAQVKQKAHKEKAVQKK